MSKTLLAACALTVLLSGAADAKWARVDSGKVVEVFGKRPQFHPDVMQSVVSCDPEVEAGWRLVNGVWVPPPTPDEVQATAWERDRANLQRLSSMAARRLMRDQMRYKLTGPLESGVPDKTKPLCVTASGEALTVTEFAEYIQERDDDGAPQQELNQLKAAAKAARKYIASLK